MDIFVARQPIFDRQRHVVAYELNHRAGRLQGVGGKPDEVARKMVNNTMLGFGLEALIGGLSGIFPASRQFLLEDHYQVLPPRQVVLNLPRSVSGDPELVEACLRATAAGYQLALAGYDQSNGHDHLLPHLSYAKASWLATPPAERKALAARLMGGACRLVVEHVGNYADFEAASAEGALYFQGSFFCEPELLHEKDIGVSGIQLAQLVAEVNRPDLDVDRLEAIIKGEVALSFKLLRYLNSAGLGWRHEVTTIGQALRVLGQNTTRKWASLVAMTMAGDHKPRELMQTSLLRAQLCEEVGALALGDSRRSELFLVGLLSTLDALLDRPMPILLEQMKLGREIVNTLLGDETPLRTCLDLTIAYDKGEWAKVDSLAGTLGIDPAILPVAYHRTVSWVAEVMQAA
jgi:EAL and modified HD-GYP domain-containing signal transduction protein